jgi:hypothetical protein
VPDKFNIDICTDTTYNCTLLTQVNSLESGARIAIQFVLNKRETNKEYNPKKAEQKYKVSPANFGILEGYYVSYYPKKVKGCRICGKEYLDFYVLPVSEFVSMYIYFSGHGDLANVTRLHADFDSFVKSFVKNNETSFNQFLLFNDPKYPNFVDTTIVGAGVLHYFSNDLFKVKKTVDGVVIKQIDYFVAPLKIEITARAVTEERKDTILTTSLGSDPDLGYSGYFVMQNYLRLSCYRYIERTDGSFIKLTINGVVQIEDQAMISYYKRVMQFYANSLVALNKEGILGNNPFTFAYPANSRRGKDIVSMSGAEMRFGHINHDSLLHSMPGYTDALDSVVKYMAQINERLAVFDDQIAKKEKEIDSTRATSSPLLNALRETQLQQLNDQRLAYLQYVTDTVSYYERIFLDPFYDKLQAACDVALKNSNCSVKIDTKNVPMSTGEKVMEFVDLNEEVGEILSEK